MVGIVEVGPRDGLQNESVVLNPTARVELIRRLVGAGLTRIEAVSFVDPRRVPQMAEAEAVMAAVPRRPGLSYTGLVLNEKGVQRAVDAGVDEVNVVIVCSDTFGLRNQGRGRVAMIDLAGRLVGDARSAGLRTTVTLAAAFGCPFEGDVPADRVLATAEAVLVARPDELALADTIGSGVPDQVRTLLTGVRALDADVTLRCHFHNTRNSGYANAHAAVDAGVDWLDASVGGLGGCPFAPRATGNIATEDLVWQLQRSGLAKDVDVDAVLGTHAWVADAHGITMPGLVARAGVFPVELVM